MSKICIEIPTCNKQTFEKYLEKNLSVFEKVNRLVSFNILFQKEFNEEDVERYTQMFKEKAIEFHSQLKDSDYDGYLCQMRNDCHIINTDAEYFLSTDDDVEYKPSFADDLEKAIVYLDSNQDYSGLVFDNNYNRLLSHKTMPLGIIIEKPKIFIVWTAGGILARNYEDLYDEEFLNHRGAMEDKLLSDKLLVKGKFGIYHTKAYSHYEHRKSFKDAGYYRYDLERFAKNKLPRFSNK